MSEERKPVPTLEEKKVKKLDLREVTSCQATLQMLKKLEEDGHDSVFHRAADMKPCPIGS